MDALSDLLRVVRLDGAYFYAVEAADPWSIEAMPAKELTPRIMPAADHLISYHILTQGRCYGGLRGEEQVELAPGDVIVFPHGDAHVMSGQRVTGTSPELRTNAAARYPATVMLGPQGPRETSFVCGFLGCDRRPFNPLLAALPRRMHMRGMSNAWLAGFTRRLTEESRLARPGADGVLTKLAELMFIDVLRRYLDELPPGQTGWLAGVRDEVVGRVLALVHGQPGHPWSLADLAREVASSRTNLAKRFAQLVGQPPMQYLTQWRMQVAANLLAQSGAKIATIGAEVGYDSEAAFSRAFKEGNRARARRMARCPSPRSSLIPRLSPARRSRKSGRPVIGPRPPSVHNAVTRQVARSPLPKRLACQTRSVRRPAARVFVVRLPPGPKIRSAPELARSGPRLIFSPSHAALPRVPRSSSRGWSSVRPRRCSTSPAALAISPFPQLVPALASGIDIAANLIAQAQVEARSSGCAVHFDVGDAEALPYVDGQFDTTVTMFGAMFAYRPERAAAELARVTRPRGRVAMANWTPEGFIGHLLRAHTAVVPPPSGLAEPVGLGRPGRGTHALRRPDLVGDLHQAHPGAPLSVTTRGGDRAVRHLLRTHGIDAARGRSRGGEPAAHRADAALRAAQSRL